MCSKAGVSRVVCRSCRGSFRIYRDFWLGALMVSQVNQLAGDLPGYQSTLRDKIQGLRGAAGGAGTLERASEVLHNLSKEIDKTKS